MNLLSFVKKYSTQCILILGILLACFNIRQAIHCGQNLGCIDGYWAQFWITSYTGGYQRRALLGQVVEYFFAGRIHYSTINILALINVLSMLLCVYIAYFKKYRASGYWFLPFLIVLSGPSTTVLFEVMGDSLHVSFLIVFLYAILAKRFNRVSALVSGLVSALLVVLIHEASIFLFLPAIYFIYCSTQEADFDFRKVFAVIFLLAAGYSLIFNNPPEIMRHVVGIISKDSSVFYPANDALLSFTSLIGHEADSYFGSVKNFAVFLVKIFRVSIWPIAAIFIFVNIFRDNNLFGIFLTLLILSLPLYIVAHDWGRFEIYTFLNSIYLSGILSADGKKMCLSFNKPIARVTEIFNNFSSMVGIKPWCFGFFPMVYISHEAYRASGLNPVNTVYLLFGLAFSGMLFLLVSD